MVGFLDLPVEIRQLIYGYLFVDGETSLFLWLDALEKPRNYPQQYEICSRLNEVPAHRGILAVCWQTYEEAIDQHVASLTHLNIAMEGLQRAWPVSYRRHNAFTYRDESRYEEAIQKIHDRLLGYYHFKKLLHKVQKLTLPDFVSHDRIAQLLQLSILPRVCTVEFVAQEGRFRDIYFPDAGSQPQLPLYSSRFYSFECIVNKFSAERHLHRSELSRHPLDVYYSTEINKKFKELFRGIRILWSAEIECALSCDKQGKRKKDSDDSEDLDVNVSGCRLRFVSVETQFFVRQQRI